MLSSRADTVFSDDFSSSTINQVPAAPTATATSYQFFSGLSGGSASIAAGDLHLAMPNTSSVLGEAQALFTSTPITLATVGDYLDVTATFMATSGIMGSGNNSSTLNIGLFNSGGAAPNQGPIVLNTGNTTGGAQTWLGYAGRIFVSGNASLFTRPSQTANGSTSQNQDLLFTGASGSQAFNSPSGTGLGSTASAVALTAGGVYTLDFRVTLSAAGTLSISNALYSGSSVNALNAIFAQQKSASGANLLTSSFDGLAMGWRYSGTAAASSMDISSLVVTDQITVPEPNTLALVGLGLGSLLIFRRRD